MEIGYAVHARFWSKVGHREGDGCWLWLAGKSPNGYGWFHLDGKDRIASRVAWVLANGEDPGDGYVCHHCDNPICVNPAHLYLGDAKTNGEDKARRGRARTGDQRGEKNPRSTLDADKVRAIRRMYRECIMPQSHIAALFGVAQSTIHKVVTRKRWGHIE